ncbi:hypothetical protein F0562_015348 [Nyssa sinensis]|uniref:DUF3741 domain-containing protein n=1 Tax=Nyssa sinensis TaxID=561372 RepID=A0A5J4ZGR4_9ASTE|nr:hypothetical protein F0562_015348 [Nyssa sinensis]
MLKRQETVLSSSSRRETVPENHHAKTIGCICMSGIFHFVSKYQRHRRKFLTFGRKHDKNSEQQTKSLEGTRGDRVSDIRRFSCDVQRSPTLRAEIRRSNSVNSRGNCQGPPALMARLMRLEEVPARSSSPESVAEKRLKLLRALEKCDEDLKALKKIIEAVQSREHLPSLRPAGAMDGADKERTICGGKDDLGGGGHFKQVKICSEFNSEQQPSPVSVLDELTRSILSSYSKTQSNANIFVGRRMQQQPKPQPRKKAVEEDIINVCFFNKITTQLFQPKQESAVSPLWSSEAMKKSVEQVCKDIAWGEKREIWRIGLVLQDNICRDLIEETVKELGCPNLKIYSLPLQGCKRRLSF